MDEEEETKEEVILLPRNVSKAAPSSNAATRTGTVVEQEKKFEVFISYHQDGGATSWAVRALRRELSLALPCDLKQIFMDVESLDHLDKMLLYQRESKVVIVLLTQHALERPHVLAEVAHANHYKIPLILVMVDGFDFDIAKAKLSLEKFDFKANENKSACTLLLCYGVDLDCAHDFLRLGLLNNMFHEISAQKADGVFDASMTDLVTEIRKACEQRRSSTHTTANRLLASLDSGYTELIAFDLKEYASYMRQDSALINGFDNMQEELVEAISKNLEKIQGQRELVESSLYILNKVIDKPWRSKRNRGSAQAGEAINARGTSPHGGLISPNNEATMRRASQINDTALGNEVEAQAFVSVNELSSRSLTSSPSNSKKEELDVDVKGLIATLLYYRRENVELATMCCEVIAKIASGRSRVRDQLWSKGNLYTCLVSMLETWPTRACVETIINVCGAFRTKQEYRVKLLPLCDLVQDLRVEGKDELVLVLRRTLDKEST